MNNKIIVRYSPSDTGFLHIGGLRTLMWNYMWAKKHKNSSFHIRIENTDVTRRVDGSVDYLFKSLEWLGITFDADVITQSERTDIYKSHVLELVKKGQAYFCFDSAEELSILRGNNPEKPVGYGAYTREKMRNSLTLPKETVEELIHKGTPYIIRFKIEKNKTIIIDDGVRGKVSFNTNNLIDAVLIKSDG